MKPIFNVSVLKFRIVEALSGSWSTFDLRALLDIMGFDGAGDLSEDDLLEICLMSLQDLEPSSAAKLLLRYKLADRLSLGQIDNMASEMIDEKLWEEYADISLHECLFNIGSLLYASRPSLFPKPEAVVMSLNIVATNSRAKEILGCPVLEPFLVRILSDGVDEQAALHRLFEQQLSSGPFPEAESIIWTVETTHSAQGLATVDVISSGYWFDSLKEIKHYESHAMPYIAHLNH